MAPKIKVALFALRGFDEALIESVYSDSRYQIVGFYTRDDSFLPYLYKPFSSVDFCKKNSIPHFNIDPKGSWTPLSAELALIFTFHRILTAEHLSLYSQVINIHPSILPHYRGATPLPWMIKNNEANLGLSAHIVTSEVDKGDVLGIRKVFNAGWSEGESRSVLSNLSFLLIHDLLNDFANKDLKSLPINQWPSVVEKRSVSSAQFKVDQIKTLSQLRSLISAFEPWPRLRLIQDNNEFIVDMKNGRKEFQLTVEETEITLLGQFESYTGSKS